MKNKSNILNISLAVILIISLTVGIVLYNNLLKTKKVYADIESQFNKDEKQLKKAQAEWATLQKDIADAKKAKEEKALAQTPTGMSTADPNKKLLNGLTLSETRKSVDKEIAALKEFGSSDTEIKNTINEALKGLGTTYDEVMSLPAPQTQPSTVTQPSTSGSSSSSTSNSTSSSSKSGGSSSSSKSGGSSASTTQNSQSNEQPASQLDGHFIDSGELTTTHSGQDSGLH